MDTIGFLLSTFVFSGLYHSVATLPSFSSHLSSFTSRCLSDLIVQAIQPGHHPASMPISERSLSVDRSEFIPVIDRVFLLPGFPSTRRSLPTLKRNDKAAIRPFPSLPFPFLPSTIATPNLHIRIGSLFSANSSELEITDRSRCRLPVLSLHAQPVRTSSECQHAFRNGRQIHDREGQAGREAERQTGKTGRQADRQTDRKTYPKVGSPTRR